MASEQIEFSTAESMFAYIQKLNVIAENLAAVQDRVDEDVASNLVAIGEQLTALQSSIAAAGLNGFDVKASCRVASTGHLNLDGQQVVDGVTVGVGDRVLVKDQTDASTNGIWVVEYGLWTRAADADNQDSTSEITAGMWTYIEEGTEQAKTGWMLVTTGAIVPGSTAMVFTQFPENARRIAAMYALCL